MSANENNTANIQQPSSAASAHNGDVTALADQPWVKMLAEIFVGDGLMECLTINTAINGANGTSPTGETARGVSVTNLTYMTTVVLIHGTN